MKSKIVLNLLFLTVILAFFSSCDKAILIKSGDLTLEINSEMYSRINSSLEGSSAMNDVFQRSDYLVTKNFNTDAFTITENHSSSINDSIGKGEVTVIQGEFLLNQVSITKVITAKTYENFPDVVFMEISYINSGSQDIVVNKWVNNKYQIEATKEAASFWTFNGSSSTNREDWIKEINPGFYQKNYLGMNQSDYGGGIPVSDVWRRDAGIAVGHTRLIPQEVSIPIDYDKYAQHASLSVEKEFNIPISFSAGDTLSTIPSFVSVHSGDYFTTLDMYSRYMQKQGIKFVETEDAAFESIWCGWGYERSFTTEEIIQTLPKVKELGIKWAVIDDGYQISEGDWRIDKNRFPGGDADMKKMVKAIHSYGLKAKLWWAPIAADPGSKVLEDTPDALLINEQGSPQFITWWDSYYLSPASLSTIEYTKETVKMFMEDWGFDGLKMDGQHMNAAPADHNWERPLEYPEKSIEMLPELFKTIYTTAREIKPNAVLENCPCGTCMSFYNMPYTNQSVSSDPMSSWQIRHKGKTYKAIMPHTAYYGDHVELSDSASDFASSFGVGAVLGTKFTWPVDNPNVKTSYLLTPEKEIVWKKWFSMYNEKMLSKEVYLGKLYDIGFDKPETHVIQKADTLYYAFYDKEWNGKISLRGLKENTEYVAYDYVNNKQISISNDLEPTIEEQFTDYLLIAVYPKN